jgi:hypothetical protein
LATPHTSSYAGSGHFLLLLADFTPQKLLIELDRPRDNFVSVTFGMVATGFAQASQVVEIIGFNANKARSHGTRTTARAAAHHRRRDRR